jgi:hypothetical protein
MSHEHDYILYEKHGCWDDPKRSGWSEIKYSLLRPATLTIRKSDGTFEKRGYGIGEILYVMEPRVQTLQSLSELLEEVPLKGGEAITGWPDDLKTARIWS